MSVNKVKWMTQKHTKMLISGVFGDSSDFLVGQWLINFFCPRITRVGRQIIIFLPRIWWVGQETGNKRVFLRLLSNSSHVGNIFIVLLQRMIQLPKKSIFIVLLQRMIQLPKNSIFIVLLQRMIQLPKNSIFILLLQRMIQLPRNSIFIVLLQRMIQLPKKKKKKNSDLPTLFQNEAEIGNRTIY